MLFAASIFALGAPESISAPSAPVRPTALQCKIAAFRVTGYTAISQAMIERAEKRGVTPERREKYEALKKYVATNEPLVTRVIGRYGYYHATDAEDAAFGYPYGDRLTEILKAC
jgi:hypothetical protein